MPETVSELQKYRNKLTHLKEAAKRNYFEDVFSGPCNPSYN